MDGTGDRLFCCVWYAISFKVNECRSKNRPQAASSNRLPPKMSRAQTTTAHDDNPLRAPDFAESQPVARFVRRDTANRLRT